MSEITAQHLLDQLTEVKRQEVADKLGELLRRTA